MTDIKTILNTTKVKKTSVGKSGMTSGDKFSVTISRTITKKRGGFHFHDNYRNSATDEDLLECLLRDAQAYECSPSIPDFLVELGYDTKDVLKGIEAHKGCKAQSKRLHRLFTQEEIDLLDQYFNEKYC